MQLSPCRFKLPLMDNDGQPIDERVIIDLHLCQGRQRRRTRRKEVVMNQNMTKQLVAEAKKIARQVDSWISLSNALSDPQEGLIARYFPNADERQEFLSSPEFEELNQLLLQTIKRKGLFPGTANGRNGKSG